MKKGFRHIKFVTGLWLFATIWPVVFIPLHFLFAEHHACSFSVDSRGSSVSGEKATCGICNFEFYWKFPDPGKILIHRIDILLQVKNEILIARLYNLLYQHILLRGPPSLFSEILLFCVGLV